MESTFKNVQNTAGPKFVEDFFTKKQKSFKDRYEFYAWMREAFPIAFTRAIMSHDDAMSLKNQASEKYPDYDFKVVADDRRPQDCQVWCELNKSINRQNVYNVVIGYATSISDIDSMIRNFESNIYSIK